jgi:hypothetical protein
MERIVFALRMSICARRALLEPALRTCESASASCTLVFAAALRSRQLIALPDVRTLEDGGSLEAEVVMPYDTTNAANKGEYRNKSARDMFFRVSQTWNSTVTDTGCVMCARRKARRHGLEITGGENYLKR